MDPCLDNPFVWIVGVSLNLTAGVPFVTGAGGEYFATETGTGDGDGD